MLERKLKRGMVSGKEAHPLPPLSMNEAGIRSLMATSFDSAVLPPVLRGALRLMEPALLNRYHRHYFLSRDGKFRLTVDSDLQFAAARFNCWPGCGSWLAASTVIIEIKFAPDSAANAAGITNALPFRLVRFSKYIEGMGRT